MTNLRGHLVKIFSLIKLIAMIFKPVQNLKN